MDTNTISIAQTPTGAPSFASQVLSLVNKERAKAGLPAYATTQPLSTGANARAKELTRTFSHTRPNGSSFFTALRQYGAPFTAAGENIAYGQQTPQAVVTAWMGSPGHRRNILSPRFKKIGIGVAQKGGRYYWDQLFTN